MKRLFGLLFIIVSLCVITSCASVEPSERIFKENVYTSPTIEEVVYTGREATVYKYTRKDFLKKYDEIVNKSEFFSCYQNSVRVYNYNGSRGKIGDDYKYENVVLVFKNSMDGKYPKILCFGIEGENVGVFSISKTYINACKDQEAYTTNIISNFFSDMGNTFSSVGQQFGQ